MGAEWMAIRFIRLRSWLSISGFGVVFALALTQCESTGGAPTDIALTTATDTTVRVSWAAPAGGAPDSYVVAFMATGTSAWVDFDAVTDSATTTDHNPMGKTGKYRVTAVFGTSIYAAAETPTSAPVHTEATIVSELNAAGLSGYGWTRDSGNGVTFAMIYASKAAEIDFYITDWATGYMTIGLTQQGWSAARTHMRTAAGQTPLSHDVCG
jgi:hypothetical protein